MSTNRIGLDQHVFIAGMTGSGKSHLARAYLSVFPRVVKLDTKGEALDDIRKKKNPWPQVDPKKLVIVQRLDDVIDADADGYPKIIYCPTFDELEPNMYNEFFKWAYFRKNITVWVDELMEVTDSPHNILPYLKAILTRGRSRDTAAWMCTQRPLGIPPLCISQSFHIFAFDLNIDQDRKKIADVTGVTEFYENPGWHNFWYWQMGWQRAVLGRIES